MRAADQYVTERLVKDEPPGGAPFAKAETTEPSQRIPSEGEQTLEKWNELKRAKLITTSRTHPKNEEGVKPRKTKDELLSEINSVSGYENWKYIPKPNKPCPSAIPVVAIEIVDVEVGAVAAVALVVGVKVVVIIVDLVVFLVEVCW